MQTPNSRAKNIIVNTWNCVRKISVADILYIQANPPGSRIFLINGETVECRDNLSVLLSGNSIPCFFQIHRQYIVNLCHVLELHHTREIDSVEFDKGEIKLPVARRRKKQFVDAWGSINAVQNSVA